MQPVIQVSGLSKHYGGFKAVDDLSFSVYKGDVFGFLGQNGAGKSTTIRMLLTLVRPTSGEIRIFGSDLIGHRTRILSRVGAVIEKPDLYGYLSGYENLSIFARLSGRACSKADLEGTLEKVGLASRAKSKVRTYSQGMKQRLGIACALVHDPELVVLDEPTNGLDPQGISDIRHLILSLSRDHGKTFLVSSHLLAEMELIASRLLIIDRGRKVVEGGMHELMDPQRLVVRIGTADDAAAKTAIASGAWVERMRADSGKGIVMDLSREEVPRLVSDMVAMKVDILSLEPLHTLEDYFLNLTNAQTDVDAGAH
jgi:ABC-type multidrug transport system ATPase subunit